MCFRGAGIRKLARGPSGAYENTCALEQFGYPTRHGEAALAAAGGDVAAALVVAFKAHALNTVPGDWTAWPAGAATAPEAEEQAEAWAEERVALESIFGDDVKFPTSACCVVSLPPEEGSAVDAPVVLEVTLPPRSAYPAVPPLLAVRCR